MQSITKAPYSTVSLTFQRQFGGTWLADVGYYGSNGNSFALEVSPARCGVLLNCTAASRALPAPALTLPLALSAVGCASLSPPIGGASSSQAP